MILRGCALASLAISCSARCESPAAPASYDLAPGFLQMMGPGPGPGIDLPKPIERAHGVTEFDFPDGSRLVVKGSQFSPGSASVTGLIGSGRLGLSPSLAGASWAVAFLPLGGTTWGSYEQIEYWLKASGHSVQLNFTPETRAFHFGGTSSRADVGYQVALLCGMARHPAVGDVVLKKSAQFSTQLNAQIDSNPGLVFSRAVQRAVSGLGPRYSELPVKAELAAAGPNALDQIVRSAMSGPIDMAIAGDVNASAIASVFRDRCVQWGARGKSRSMMPIQASFQAGKHVWTFVQADRTSQPSADGVFWSTAIYGRGDRHRLALDVLAEVLKVRVSLGRSRPGTLVMPITGSFQGFSCDSFGYFGLGLEAAQVPSGGIERFVRSELGHLLRDPQFEGQVRAVLDARAVSGKAVLSSNTRWAEALAESLTEPDALDRLLVFNPPTVQSAVEDARNAAAWLAREKSVAVVEVHPRS